MRDKITITLEEYTDLVAYLWTALLIKCSVTEDNKKLYLDITSGLSFMFTDDYQELKEKGEING